MNRTDLKNAIISKQSFLCVGLDTDITKIPAHLLACEDPVFEFNKAIIDATKDFTIAYKINTAFYEAMGIKGWVSMEKTLNYIPQDIFTIADAKRGDIGNTSDQYAKTFFETYQFDSVTVAPYMGHDSIASFLQYEGKFAIILGLTSNTGSLDFQQQSFKDGLLYESVLKTAATWGSIDNTMFVIGATRTEFLENVRRIIPKHFLLVPGVGAQGGDLKSVAEICLNEDGGLMVNVSRGVIYVSKGTDFAEQAGASAKAYQEEMAALLKAKNLI
ncbi:MAG TPA: orotidine-5'-phosphate decarboxylase [Edaphocola sp.]|nr:orotidine-5'-phosphate decarboxylase [Edaphocola sp.]